MLVTALALGLLPGSAGAASVAYTAQSSGRGLTLSLGGTDISEGPLSARTADTDRIPEPNGNGVADCVVNLPADPGADQNCEAGPQVGGLIPLPFPHDIINANVIAQDATVDNNGNSSACAGLIGAGGLIQLDDATKGCDDDSLDPGTPAGVIINLSTGVPLNLFRIRADAITSSCTAVAPHPLANPATPASATGSTSLANAVLEYFDPLDPLLVGSWKPILTLPAGNPAPNSPILFPPGAFEGLNALIGLTANEQFTGPGKMDVTALHLTILGAVPGGLIDIKIGRTTCGLNTAVVTADTTTSSSSTSSSSSSSTSSSSSSSSSSTSSTAPTSSSSSSTTSSTAPTSTSSSSTTSSTAPTSSSSSSTSSTVLDPGSSSTSSSSSSTSSTALGGTGGATTSTTKAGAIVKTGANTRAQLSLALGLLGLGFVVTGRGMQLGFDGPERRRRR